MKKRQSSLSSTMHFSPFLPRLAFLPFRQRTRIVTSAQNALGVAVARGDCVAVAAQFFFSAVHSGSLQAGAIYGLICAPETPFMRERLHAKEGARMCVSNKELRRVKKG